MHGQRLSRNSTTRLTSAFAIIWENRCSRQVLLWLFLLFAVIILVATQQLYFIRSRDIWVDDNPGSGFPEEFSLFDNPQLSQTDPRILEYLLKNSLIPKNSEPSNTGAFGNPGFSQIQTIFGSMRNGIFVEAGANDGVFLSNTLYLEQELGWTGLLIEPNKFIFPELKLRNRKAWIANLCLAVKPYPHKVNILHRIGNKQNPSKAWFKGNGIIEPNSDVPSVNGFQRTEYISGGETECFPLFSMLSAINMTTVDYFSLDVEGVEMKILETIPFEWMTINVLTVEHNVAPEGKEAIRSFMIAKGYEMYSETGNDFTFVKKGFRVGR